MALTAELVARCERAELDPGPPPRYERLTDEEYEAAAHHLLNQRGPGPLWVFVYGSLMWKPAFTSLEHRRATVFGWHRAFCLELRRWRGSPQQPGLMLALDRGGCCEGPRKITLATSADCCAGKWDPRRAFVASVGSQRKLPMGRCRP